MKPFTTHHRKLLLLLTAGGTYLPGLEPSFFGLRVPCVLVYNLVVQACRISFCVDMFLTGFMRNLPFFEGYYFVTVGVVFIWLEIKAIYIYYKYEHIIDIFTFWTQKLQSEMSPDIRKHYLDRKMSKMWHSTIRIFTTAGTWWWSLGVFKLVTQELLNLTTIFDNFPPTFVILWQSISLHHCYFCWLSFDCFIGLLLNLIVVELEYLTETMTNITKVVPVSQDGCLNENERNKRATKIRRQLSMWIQHHVQVNIFCKKINMFLSPVLGGIYVYNILNICSLIISSSSGALALDSTVFAYVFCVVNCIMTYRLCRLGDEIREMSQHLGDTAVACDWIGLPQDVKKTLLEICTVTRNPMTIKVAGLMPLSSNTFHQMMVLEYRIYRFITDTS